MEKDAFKPPPHILCLEMRLANRINQERAARELHRLKYDWQVAAVARGHSEEMARLHYFDHDSPVLERKEPWDRYILHFGEEPAYIAENISRSFSHSFRPLGMESAEKAHQGLMDSPGHRANILSFKPVQMGIGVFADSMGNVWVTELFVRHLSSDH